MEAELFREINGRFVPNELGDPTFLFHLFKENTTSVFEPAQLPQETICPSVAFAKGQIGNSRGQSIIYYNINTVFVLSNKLSFCCPRKNKTLVKQCCGCGKCKFSFIFTVCKFTLIDQTETCCVIAQLNIHLSAL